MGRRGKVREAASQILLDRAREPHGLQRTLAVSVGIHFLVVVALLLNPSSWLSGEGRDMPDTAIRISLGGPAGEGQGGLTPLGGRPIQEILPLEEARRPQWIQPPTPTPPKMVMSVEEATRRTESQTDVRTTPEEARGRTPTRGPELLDGLAMADTGVEGIGVGLSAGGLGGSGAELDVGDFCCPEYLATMIELIRRNWDNKQQVPGASIVQFTIKSDGTIDGVGVDRGSGYFALDMSAQRAVAMTRRLPPLPRAFPMESLTVRLTFEYRR